MFYFFQQKIQMRAYLYQSFEIIKFYNNFFFTEYEELSEDCIFHIQDFCWQQFFTGRV